MQYTDYAGARHTHLQIVNQTHPRYSTVQRPALGRSSRFCVYFISTLYIGYTAIGYGAKSVKGWVLGCPDIPTVNSIGYNAKNQLQRGVKSVITRISCLKSVITRCLQRESLIARISSSPKSRVLSDIYCNTFAPFQNVQ